MTNIYKCHPNSFSLHVILDDGTETIRVMVTDAFMKKLTGKTCEQFVLLDGYDDRKVLPPELEAYKMQVLKLYLETTRKSSSNKISFVVVDLIDEHKQTSSGKLMSIGEKESSTVNTTMI